MGINNREPNAELYARGIELIDRDNFAGYSPTALRHASRELRAQAWEFPATQDLVFGAAQGMLILAAELEDERYFSDRSWK